MATEFSFDIVSKVDQQEVKNALDQAQKELANRYDFKGSAAKIEHEKEVITLTADDEFKLGQLKDIVESKLLKRGIDIRHLDYGKIEPGAKLTVHQRLNLKQGISQDSAKVIIKQLRDKGIKVNAQIQGDQVRVSGKVKDDLQKAINLVKEMPLDFAVQFVNYR